jgi:hypothetical protein
MAKPEIKVTKEEPKATVIETKVPNPETKPAQGETGILSAAELKALKSWARRRYFLENKEALLADFKALGKKTLLAKWNLTTKTWAQLWLSWSKPAKPNRSKTPDSSIPRDIPSSSRCQENDGTERDKKAELPPFPPWDESWSDYLKCAWLDAYARVNGGRQ